MKIEDFLEKYATPDVRSINETVRNWALEKRIDDFLIFTTSIVGDWWGGDGLADAISPKVAAAFRDLMHEKADSYLEVKRILLEKDSKSLDGLINKIQGQLGENEFVKQTHGMATLAESGSQKGWDVHIGHTDQYIQVKIYEDPDQVIKKMKKVNMQIEDGEITDGEIAVTSVDFAVNADIFEEVRQKAVELGLQNKVFKINTTRAEVRGELESSAENVIEPIENFFGELLGDMVPLASLYAASNAFLVWYGAKEASTGVEDFFYGSITGAAGVAAGSLTETILTQAALMIEVEIIASFLAGPAGLLVPVAAISTKAILRRLADRRFTIRRLAEGNCHIESLCTSIA